MHTRYSAPSARTWWAVLLVVSFWMGTSQAQSPAGETAPLAEMMSVKQVIETGGASMYILLAMSVVGLALVWYYLFSLRRSQVVPQKFSVELKQLVSAGQWEEALQFTVKDHSALAEVAQCALAYRRGIKGGDPALVKDVMEGEGSRQASLMQNQIQYLQDIAVIAPMIGLLGTVLGMLEAFNAVALDIAKAKPMVLAAGVSKALITTAAGLMVGIPAMMAYAYFRGRVTRLLAELETVSAELLASLTRPRS